MRGFKGIILLIMILFCQISFAVVQPTNIIRIGVLANSGIDECIKNWQPTANYLSNKLENYTFKIVPLSFKEVIPAVKNNQIDFIIANAHFYVLLNKSFSVSKVLTVETEFQGKKLSKFGGVLFCRASRTDIKTFEDISNKKLSAVRKTSLGGWLYQSRELLQLGIEPNSAFSSISFTGSNEKVVNEVLSGISDIGMVRTGILEKMVSDGKLTISDVRTILLTPSITDNFPLKVSTRIYPGWALAKVKKTPSKISNQIAALLLNKSYKTNQKEQISWAVPESYSEVKLCLMDLKLPPFDNERQKAIKTIIKSDPLLAIAFICFLIALILLVVKTSSFNKRLQLSNNLLETEIAEKVKAQTDLQHRLDTDEGISDLMCQLTNGMAKIETISASMLRVAVNSTKSTSGLIYTIQEDKPNVLCGIVEGRAIIDKVSLESLLDDDFLLFINKIINLGTSPSIFLNNNSEAFFKHNLKQTIFKFNSILISAIIGYSKEILGYIIVANANEYNNSCISSIERISYLLCQSLKEIRQVNERKIFEQKLLRAQKLEALGTLASGISHDFKNILLPIIGFSEMILEDAEKDSSIYSSAISILESSNRAKELTSQILSISRMNKENIETICLQDIIEEVLAFLRASIPHTISIDKACPTDKLFISGNSGQLHQVITNLCINASHAMEKNGGKLTINLSKAEEIPVPEILHRQNYSCLSISDTGTGIEKEILDKIFDPYFTTKDKEKGTGLGLATVQAIIESLGGHIGVVSEINVGTTFLIYIPLVKDLNEQNAIIGKVDGSNQHLANKLKQHILVVDDDILILEMTKKMLLRSGLEVTTFSDSVEALEFFASEHNKIDLVLSDMTMPDLTGDKLAKKMYDICPEVPFILSTGISADETLHLTSKEEITDFLPKPFQKKDIIKLLNKYHKQTKTI